MADNDQFKSVESSIGQKLEPIRKSSFKHSIYEVPECIRKVNKECYEPSVVSIGPIYYGNKSLEHFQKVKLADLVFFLGLISRHGYGLQECFNVIKGLEENARNCYQHEIHLNSNDFIEMVMIDAVFIISRFIIYSRRIPYEGLHYVHDLVVFGTMIQDLFLVENQLPFFVLNDLYNEVLGPVYPQVSFKDLTHSFICKCVTNFRKDDVHRRKIREETKVEHLVDFLKIQYLPSKPRELGQNRKFISPPTAKELMLAGVKLVATESDNLFDITFSKGVLKVPQLIICDNTEPIFRNILFFEQSHYSDGNYFIHYIHFLDELIDTPEDAQILVQNKIIENWLGSDEAAANVINNINKNVSICITEYYYNNVCLELNAYTTEKWNQWKAILKRDYFNHPWSITSVMYLVVLLILTMLQVYTGFKQLK